MHCVLRQLDIHHHTYTLSHYSTSVESLDPPESDPPVMEEEGTR